MIIGEDVSIMRGESVSFDLNGLGDISGRTKLWVTIKASVSDEDTASILQWEETEGLVYIKGAEGTPGNGAITVNNAVVGNITVTLQEVEAATLNPASGLVYDAQMFDGTNIKTLVVGQADMVGDVTRAVS